ncbi:UNVERIFIED_ORG: hypothetical protein M2438_005328 [Methylobacterium sp. SuP10 SLI 274]|uniref:hypothetical protein n=1 Tax=Methylorubrum extorquens TaxID=408 RepID=UPI00209F7823|nr:hypothetical protein [Methylorubrum extorquens]MDF9861086.1 hypothetical protein [Methylorubrum pseudosasae]MDH6640082.1 hypothetical protein [Methylobacterium sp. SuP10 SLI 274]MDH6669160.1 hypothetical protein [Methylorubrum zatmanii]MCP1556652.1 hypothetical protein [Methylorubrum extorquens]MDF9789417.1 hypothetical protein [Methylorubrum extorquens]
MSVPHPVATDPSPNFHSWRDRIERMNPATSPCPGLHGETWQRVHAAMLVFLERFGAEAVDLGWSELDLFGVHPKVGIIRADHCGALVVGGRAAQWIDPTRINFGNLTYYRDTPGQPRGIPIWAYGG